MPKTRLCLGNTLASFGVKLETILEIDPYFQKRSNSKYRNSPIFCRYFEDSADNILIVKDLVNEEIGNMSRDRIWCSYVPT